jgi:hypothetical protein
VKNVNGMILWSYCMWMIVLSLEIVEHILSLTFEMTNLDMFNFFLGIEVMQLDDGIFIS